MSPLEAPPNLLLSGMRSIVGWPSGTSIDSQETMLTDDEQFENNLMPKLQREHRLAKEHGKNIL